MPGSGGYHAFLVSFLFSTTSRMSSPKQSWECAYGWLLLFLSLFSPSNNGYPQFYTCRYLCCQLCVCPSEWLYWSVTRSHSDQKGRIPRRSSIVEWTIVSKAVWCLQSSNITKSKILPLHLCFEPLPHLKVFQQPCLGIWTNMTCTAEPGRVAEGKR